MVQTVVVPALYYALVLNVLYIALKESYEIRMHAINEYGRVIHEFDPYFNYRATEYLWQHGWTRFTQWFDYQSWYPLGRPVGTTIYPGMQVTSCLIKQYLLPTWSINDICCFVPSWFGVMATATTGLLAYECSVGSWTPNDPDGQQFSSILNDVPVVGHIYRATLAPLVDMGLGYLQRSTGTTWGLRPRRKTSTVLSSPAIEAGVASALAMSIVPAHLMRSVGGGYDNESIAMFAMTFTFYCWTRSLRGHEPNYGWSVLSGVAYFYMVAAWGGYVFVLNVVGVHATFLVLTGRYSTKLHRAYSLFYLVGTTLATFIPVVGYTPLKSLEQIGPLLAFGGFQLIEFCEVQRRQKNLSFRDAWKLRIQVFGAVSVVAAALALVLAQAGYFGPISSRVRGLFVKHTKTGNPLVDSVAEHQPGNPSSYFQYLDILCYISPVGFGIVALLYYNDSSSFLIIYGLAAYYFSLRMVRLILLTAPIASALSGIAIGHAIAWCVGAVLDVRPSILSVMGLGKAEQVSVEATPASSTTTLNGTADSNKTDKKDSKKKKNSKTGRPDLLCILFQVFNVRKSEENQKKLNVYYDQKSCHFLYHHS